MNENKKKAKISKIIEFVVINNAILLNLFGNIILFLYNQIVRKKEEIK